MKRLLSVMICTVFVLSLALPFFTTRTEAATSTYFTAVNDTLYELSDATMPFWSDGNLYIPSTVFSSSEISVNYGLDVGGSKAMLYSGNYALLFDLINGGVMTQSSVTYKINAVSKSGYVFFPMSFVCNYFSLSCNVLDTPFIPMVRIKNADAVLNDTVFVDAANSLMSSRYGRYTQSKNNSIVTEPPDTTPDAVPEEDDDKTTEEENNNDVTIYLGVRVSNAENAGKILDSLVKYSYHATFFFEKDTLAQCDDLARKIAASGYGIGFVVDCTAGSTDALEYIGAQNALLREYTATTTRLVLLENATAYGQKLIANRGYCVWRSNMNAAGVGSTATGRYNGILNRLQTKTGRVKIVMGDDKVTVSAMSGLLPRLKQGSYTVRHITEINA